MPSPKETSSNKSISSLKPSPFPPSLVRPISVKPQKTCSVFSRMLLCPPCTIL